MSEEQIDEDKVRFINFTDEERIFFKSFRPKKEIELDDPDEERYLRLMEKLDISLTENESQIYQFGMENSICYMLKDGKARRV